MNFHHQIDQLAINLFMTEYPEENAWNKLMDATKELPEEFTAQQPFENYPLNDLQNVIADTTATIKETIFPLELQNATLRNALADAIHALNQVRNTKINTHLSVRDTYELISHFERILQG